VATVPDRPADPEWVENEINELRGQHVATVARLTAERDAALRRAESAEASEAALRAALEEAESALTSSEELVFEDRDIPPFRPSAKLLAVRSALAAPRTASEVTQP
jgi:hypothetical protein